MNSLYVEEMREKAERMDMLLQEERKKQFVQHEQIMQLKSQNVELSKHTRKQSDMYGDFDDNKSHHSSVRGAYQEQGGVTVPRNIGNNGGFGGIGGGRPLSRVSMDIEEKFKNLSSELDQLDPKRKR